MDNLIRDRSWPLQ